ncbi:MAG: response regulator [Terriglobales bacterium]
MARKILLADDSVTAQNMGRRILTDAGYEVITVNNGSAALKKIAESKPDLIVLDVYMPGYGGLEVCQRLRESEETARIPVLLTVGKLEPFKAEEARRVRADAFVVKPFEASELLTALTKLEDKIVPPPQLHKPSRSAVPTTAIEQMSAGKHFGDLETGWKNRLTIPPPHQKAKEDRFEDPEVQVAPGPFLRPEAAVPPPKARAPERSVSSGMGDITPDEIAAITAAAAAFSTGAEEPFAKLIAAEPVVVADDKPASAPDTQPVVDSAEAGMGATFASAPEISVEVEKETPAEPVADTPVPVLVAPPAIEVVEATKEPVGEVPQLEVPGAQEVAIPPVSAVAETGKLGQEEVAAALASLAPVPGEIVEVSPNSLETRPASAVAAASSPEPTGPRWIAEAVALREDEGALVLEQEMVKAQAAMAALAAESASEPVQEMAVVREETPSLPEPEAPPSWASPSIEDSSPQPREEPQGLAGVAIVEESPANAVVVQAEAAPLDRSIAEVKEEAFAASASAGSPADAVSAAEATSHVTAAAETAEPALPAFAPADRPRESELAAAWASWKQVRDSVASPQFASQIADVAAAGLTDVQPPQPAAPEAASQEPRAQASAPEENGAIASIVDSVLAELKPKLMEEIAKKIKKDK